MRACHVCRFIKQFEGAVRARNLIWGNCNSRQPTTWSFENAKKNNLKFRERDLKFHLKFAEVFWSFLKFPQETSRNFTKLQETTLTLTLLNETSRNSPNSNFTELHQTFKHFQHFKTFKNLQMKHQKTSWSFVGDKWTSTIANDCWNNPSRRHYGGQTTIRETT